MNRRNGFTLVELLVVISIIMILIGIIRPMLGAAASKSRDMECESRLRQIGIALHAQAQDSGAFPARLPAVDRLLQDESLLRCPVTGRVYFYRRPPKDADRGDVTVSCVNPGRLPARLPHARGASYLALTAGGEVVKVRPSGSRP